jgi:hypothetical protein
MAFFVSDFIISDQRNRILSCYIPFHSPTSLGLLLTALCALDEQALIEVAHRSKINTILEVLIRNVNADIIESGNNKNRQAQLLWCGNA